MITQLKKKLKEQAFFLNLLLMQTEFAFDWSSELEVEINQTHASSSNILQLSQTLRHVTGNNAPDWFGEVTNNSRVSGEQREGEAKRVAHWITRNIEDLGCMI